MLLRTRLSLLGILAIIVVCFFILFASLEREQLIRAQYSKELIADQSNLWNKIADEFIDQMEDMAWIVQDNRELLSALENSDVHAIRRIGQQTITQLQNQLVADRLDILDHQGSLIYSSHTSVFQSPIVSEEIAKDAVGQNRGIRGIGNDKQRNTALVFGFPLVNDIGSVVGLFVYALDIIKPLVEMEKLNDSDIMILNRRGRLLLTHKQEIWEQYGESIDLNELNSLQTISKDDRYFSVTVVPQVAELGSLVARFVNVEEVTEQVLEQRDISRLTILFIAVFTLVSIFLLYFYMRFAFAPLSEGVKVLESLTKGDLMRFAEMKSGKDEVGQIGNAVNVFRSGMVTLNRYRRSRDRQRARQERFIFREMTKLADTLDGDDQTAVIQEFDNIAKRIESSSTRDSTDDAMTGVDLTSDEFDARAFHGSDSLVLMATAFHTMSDRVQDQHRRLREALETKQAFTALRKELDIATRVQLSILPQKSEKAKTFEIVGGMWPAKEVGGDFFDYFRIDDDHFGIAVADVSGKGVPAALFAVMASTTLRGIAPHVGSPGAILEDVNNFLEEHNDENLFITFFYGVLHEPTGRFTYANGGHNAPVIIDENGINLLDLTDGMVLGMFDGMAFEEAYFDLTPGSKMVLFTDGIPEAFNGAGEAYGDDRLLDKLNELPNRGAADDVKTIVQSVDTFVGDAPQFDDITCVVLHYKGSSEITEPKQRQKMDEKEMQVELDLKCDLSEIGRIAEKVEELGESHDWPMNWIFNTNLALDELITNVINYAFAETTDGQEIKLTLTQTEGSLIVVLEDNGLEFDPFVEADQPDIEADLEDRAIGGLGVFFVKSLVDEATYEREGDRNVVTLVLNSPEDA